MVTIHLIIQNQMPSPHRHNLQAKKKTKSFEDGEIHVCNIAQMKDGRYMVFSANTAGKKYEVIESEQELHESFTELK